MNRAIGMLFGSTILATLVVHVVTLLSDAGAFRRAIANTGESCEAIADLQGAEDFAVIPGSEWVLTATDDRREGVPYSQREQGEIWALNPVSRESYRLFPSNVEPKALEFFHPHGIEVYFSQEESRGTLFVINHLPNESVIEEFELQPDLDAVGRWELTHRATRREPGWHSLNDLVALNETDLIVSQDHGLSTPLLKRLEDYSRIPMGRLLLSTPTMNRSLVDHLSYANGLALSPDGKFLAAATMLAQEVRLFEIGKGSELLLRPVANWKLQSSPDNLFWSREGLFVASHQKMLKLSAHAKNPTSTLSPSLVELLLVGEPSDWFGVIDRPPSRQVIFADDGEQVSGASMGLPVAGKLLLGTIFTRGVLLCERP